MEKLTVSRLKISNFLKIADLEIEPNKKIVQIVGKNNTGKTSVLKAIQFALSGSKDVELIHHGSDKGEVLLELSNGTKITRNINSKGNTNLKVDVGGLEPKSPQTWLNSLMGEGIFNPLDLLDPKKRNEYILESINIDVTKEDVAKEVGCKIETLPDVDSKLHGLKKIAEYSRYFYDIRHKYGQELKQLESEKTVLQKSLEDLPEVTETMGELQLKLEEISKSYASAEIANNQIKYFQSASDSITKKIDNLKNEKEKLFLQIKSMETQVQSLIEEHDSLSKKADSSKAVSTEDLLKEKATVLEKISLWERKRRIEQDHAKVKSVEERIETKNKTWTLCDKAVKTLQNSFQSKLLAKSELPIEGLEYKEGNFYLDGSTIENLSSSKSLKLGIALARKKAKKLKIICIDGIELLDPESFALLYKEIENDQEFTYFVTKVDERFNSDSQVIEPGNIN